MQHSAVLIIPAEHKADADAAGAKMGWGSVSYTIPLGDGNRITHYAARADVGEQFIRWVSGEDPLPDPALKPVIDALIADFSPGRRSEDDLVPLVWGRAHLERVVAHYGLIWMFKQ